MTSYELQVEFKHLFGICGGYKNWWSDSHTSERVDNLIRNLPRLAITDFKTVVYDEEGRTIEYGKTSDGKEWRVVARNGNARYALTGDLFKQLDRSQVKEIDVNALGTTFSPLGIGFTRLWMERATYENLCDDRRFMGSAFDGRVEDVTTNREYRLKFLGID